MHIESDVLQGPNIFRCTFLVAVIGLAYLQIGVFLAEDSCFPPAVEVVAQCAGADQTEFVEFAHMVKPDCYIVHSYSLFLFSYLYRIHKVAFHPAEDDHCAEQGGEHEQSAIC